MEVPAKVSETTAAGTLGIGELAQLTGVPVRTIRFYCDEGILASERSTGGHRRFDAAAVDQLSLLRRLRGLGLSLPAITDVLTGRRSVAEVVAAERTALDVEMAALAWRHASLRAVETAAPAERAARLDLLAAVEDGRSAHDALVSFWRRTIAAPISEELATAIITMSVPDAPSDPTPTQVVAYAEMVRLTADRSLTRQLLYRAREERQVIADEATLLTGMAEAFELAEPLLLAGQRPGPGRALDHFVEAHAAVRNTRDTPGFRRQLVGRVAVHRDPRVRRYWHLMTEVTGEHNPGVVQAWLLDALDASVASSPPTPPALG